MADKEKTDRYLAGWSWTARDKGNLVAKFKTGLLRLMRVVQADGQKTIDADELRQHSRWLEEAGVLLDECAVNCRAVMRVCNQAVGDTKIGLSESELAARLRRSIDKPVVLTHTTIEELRGKKVYIAQVNEDNGIIRNGEDYWGTPLGRILMLPTEEETPVANNEKNESHEPSPQLLQLLEQLNADKQPPIVICLGSSSNFVHMNASAENTEVVSIESLPEDVRSQILSAKHNADDVLLFEEGGSKLQNDFHFRLKNGELANALQFLTMMNRRGRLDVASEGGEVEGGIYVEAARVVHAEFGNFDGVRAVAEMLTLEHAEAEFIADLAPPCTTVTLGINQLLVEAAIQADELISSRRKKRIIAKQKNGK